jgi:Flp pilus assembly protein TadG
MMRNMKQISTQTMQATNAFLGRFLHLLACEEGSQLVELALVLPMLLMLLAGTVDCGRAFYLNMEVASAAEAGAIYGTQNPTDISGMKSAAVLNAQDIGNLTTAATYGTECSDGTSAVSLAGTPPSCIVDVVQYVEVDTTASYRPILIYPGLQSNFTLTGKSRMRAFY